MSRNGEYKNKPSTMAELKLEIICKIGQGNVRIRKDKMMIRRRHNKTKRRNLDKRHGKLSMHQIRIRF